LSAFHRVLDDLDHPGRWHLRAPATAAGGPVDPWPFTSARPLDGLPELQVPVRHPGLPLDFTFAGFDVPVVSGAVKAALAALAPELVQWIGVKVTGQPVPVTSFAILNALRKARCLDESRSAFVPWTVADRRPDRVGSYRMVTRLVIDPARAPSDIFRIEGWKVALIVSDAVRSALAPFSGIRFEAVSQGSAPGRVED
jgi:hypothetical protein